MRLTLEMSNLQNILLIFLLAPTAVAVIFGAGFFLGYSIAWDIGRTLLQREINESKNNKNND